MGHAWNMNGTCMERERKRMERERNTHGPYMEHEWNMHGTRMELESNMKRTEHAWYTRGTRMEHSLR
eukprot:7280959-Lingulodinium_polyedra.AAC.1